jgi:hypothetical protein
MDTADKKSRNPNDLLIFQNIDTEDLEWQYDAIKTPLPYYIKTGETRELPYFIAQMGVSKLIDRMLQKANKNHINPLFRAELMDKIILGIKHINYIREKTPNEIALEELQRKKETDPIEELLARRQVEAERLEAQKIAALTPPAPLIQTVGTPVPPPPPPAMQAAPVTPTSIPAGVDTQRVELYAMLTNDLHMDLNHQPTKEKLDATPLDQLKKEFASQLPELGIESANTPLGIKAPVVNSTPYIPPAETPANAILDGAMPTI